MKKLILTAVMVLAYLSVARADSMRCGNNIISDGASKAMVILRCGQPFYREQVEIQGSGQSQTQGQILKHDKNSYNYFGSTSSRSVEISIEKLFYNLDEGQLIRILTFKAGTLIKIETGDRP